MRKKKDDKGNSNAVLVRCTVGLAIAFLLLVGLFFIGDWLDLAEKYNLHFRFDWAATACAFLSAVASIFLASVSVIQNKKAGEANERLAKINQDQFEASIINNNYPLIKFCDLQRIGDDNGAKKFVFKFFDTRNIPLKEVYTSNVGFVPLADIWKDEDQPKWVIMREKKQKDKLQFTYSHEGINNDGFYMVTVPMKEPMFDGYRYCRVELEMDLVSTTGVVTKCKGYAMLDSDGEREFVDNRKNPYVYHQFFEIKEIMSEKKYLSSK